MCLRLDSPYALLQTLLPRKCHAIWPMRLSEKLMGSSNTYIRKKVVTAVALMLLVTNNPTGCFIPILQSSCDFFPHSEVSLGRIYRFLTLEEDCGGDSPLHSPAIRKSKARLVPSLQVKLLCLVSPLSNVIEDELRSAEDTVSCDRRRVRCTLSMLLHPHVMKEAQEEMDSVVGPDR